MNAPQKNFTFSYISFVSELGGAYRHQDQVPSTDQYSAEKVLRETHPFAAEIRLERTDPVAIQENQAA